MAKIQTLVKIEQGVPVQVGPVPVQVQLWMAVPVQVQGVPVQVTKKCPEYVFFSHFSMC